MLKRYMFILPLLLVMAMPVFAQVTGPVDTTTVTFDTAALTDIGLKIAIVGAVLFVIRKIRGLLKA